MVVVSVSAAGFDGRNCILREVEVWALVVETETIFVEWLAAVIAVAKCADLSRIVLISDSGKDGIEPCAVERDDVRGISDGCWPTR